MINFQFEIGGFFVCDCDMYLLVYMLWYKILVLCLLQCVLILLEGIKSEIIGLVFGYNMFNEFDNDLILNYVKFGEMLIGQCILVYGCVFDECGVGVFGVLVEFWQVNVGGCYCYKKEIYFVVLDLNFGGVG